MVTRSALNNFDRVSLFGEGLQTCFYRATQTYTALLWNSKSSPYSSENFLMTTEECFGDLINEARNLGLSTETSDFNELASLAHWFHLGVIDVKTPVQTVQNKYENLERKKDDLLSDLDGLNQSYKNKVFNMLHTMGAFILLLLGGIFYYYRKKQKEDELIVSKKMILEERARNEIDSRDFPMSSRVEHILLESLNFNGLSDCRELFFNYHTLVLEGKILSPTLIQKDQKEEEVKEKDITPFSLNNQFEAVLDEVHPKLIESKIFYMDDFASEIELYGSSEKFRSLIKVALEEGMKSIPFTAEKKLVNVSTKKLGGTVTMNIEFLCDQSDQNISHNQRIKEQLVSKIEKVKSELDVQVNVISMAKSMSCKGLNFQLVFTLPQEVTAAPVKKTTIRKFRKKDFLKHNNPSAT